MGITKRKFHELVKDFLTYMNEINTKVDVNITPSSSYDCLFGMDCVNTWNVQESRDSPKVHNNSKIKHVPNIFMIIILSKSFMMNSSFQFLHIINQL